MIGDDESRTPIVVQVVGQGPQRAGGETLGTEEHKKGGEKRRGKEGPYRTYHSVRHDVMPFTDGCCARAMILRGPLVKSLLCNILVVIMGD